MAPITLENSYASLPERFYSRIRPTPVKGPQTAAVNDALARHLGFEPEWLWSKAGADFITGNTLLAGSDPIATVYAGHQFGNWVPRLGDGRAVLLGEVQDRDGIWQELQLKGAGQTPYSRSGDGRAPLGPILRELLVSEAMANLGVPTSQVLAAAATGELVYRERPTPGGVLVRVARSHIRIGTFEYFAARDDKEAVELLTNYVIDRLYPEISGGSAVDLLRALSKRQADLVAQWQCFAFIHGVMNTDNMLLSGEAIDYGPCAFMNEYDPATVFSSIDYGGRYAYGNQPAITQWNLARLAQAFLRVSDDRDALLPQMQEVIDEFSDEFKQAYRRRFLPKLGLLELKESDWGLIEDYLATIYEAEVDFTLSFRGLMGELGDEPSPAVELPAALAGWLERWRGRLAEEGRPVEEVLSTMGAVNPVFIPRNHLVEHALKEAVRQGNMEPYERLRAALRKPFSYREEFAEFALPPGPEEGVHVTFCGT